MGRERDIAGSYQGLRCSFLPPVGRSLLDEWSFRGTSPGKAGGLPQWSQVCGNEYDKAFEVVIEQRAHVFASFERAIHALAPTRAHCGCKIVGHGIEARGTFYRCVNCASAEGVSQVQDRV
jgi:hypothetical protein